MAFTLHKPPSSIHTTEETGIQSTTVETVTKAIEDELAKGHQLSVIKFVNLLIERACIARASDIHLDPRPDGVVIRLRIDGVLQDVHVLPTQLHNEVISRIKILSSLRTDEHQAAQDGRFRIELSDKKSVDVRVSIMPVYYGEDAVLRILVDQVEAFTLDSLGFTKENQEKIVRAMQKPHGMILATGPTGSGKTTTLYTLVQMLNRPGISIITLEDPVEYAIRGVNQIQINQRTGLTFAHGLRSILRQDPNVIMVGEIRDTETAGLAVNTALTGHLVLSTLHTNDAPTTLPRLLDMKIEPYLIASTVNLAIGQRLVRRICECCSAQKEVTATELKSIATMAPPGFFGDKPILYAGTGCVACGFSGYKGRIGIYEVIEIDTPIRDAILRKAPARELRDIAMQQGMVPMILDGFHKVTAGCTTIEEVLRMHYE